MASIVVWIAGLFVAGVAVGVIVGRWWAVLLAALVPIGFIPAGDDSDGAPEWQTALAFLMPIAVVGIVVGVTARRVWDRRRRAARAV